MVTEQRNTGFEAANTPAPAKRKQHGRNLDDVRAAREFSSAERILIDAAARGIEALIGTTVPKEYTEDNRVRAELIRFLALGGDDLNPLHEKGVRLSGAWIEGNIDLQGCTVSAPINLSGCLVDGGLTLVDASIVSLILNETTLNHINGDRVCCSGGLFIRYNSHVKGVIRLIGGRIDGDFELIGARIDGKVLEEHGCKVALLCSGMEVGGSVNGRRAGKELPAFIATGLVSFYGTTVKGDLVFNDATFNADKMRGLDCDYCDVGGSFLLARSVHTGRLRLLGAKVAGDLLLARTRFDGAGQGEIVLTRAHIGGRLIFYGVSGSIDCIVLRAASANALIDDMASWQIARSLLLDGFRYERIVELEYIENDQWVGVPAVVDATSRIGWLRRQHETDLGKDFKPQPWEQIIKALRDMGHEEDARAIAIKKQVQKRKAWRAQGRGNEAFSMRLRLQWIIFWHWMYGILSRYGYRPSLLILWAIAIGFSFAILFAAAENAGVMAPTDRTVLGNSAYDRCRPEGWTRCAELSGKYPAFDPVIYSFDLMLPVIATQQTKDWSPSIVKNGAYWPLGSAIWLLARIENVFGWILGLMFVATVSGLVKKD